MIKVVLFDFGGVLTEGGTQGFITRVVAALYGLPVEKVDIADLHGDLRRGKSDEAAFFDELNRRYGDKKRITQEDFLARIHTKLTPSQPVYDLARRLRVHDIRTAILSNIFDMNAQLLRKQGWYKDFDPLILSCEEGYAKPDPEIYSLTIKRLGVRPQEILFIDDQEKCLGPAKELGMQTICAVSPGQIVSDTERLIKRINNTAL